MTGDNPCQAPNLRSALSIRRTERRTKARPLGTWMDVALQPEGANRGCALLPALEGLR